MADQQAEMSVADKVRSISQSPDILGALGQQPKQPEKEEQPAKQSEKHFSSDDEDRDGIPSDGDEGAEDQDSQDQDSQDRGTEDGESQDGEFEELRTVADLAKALNVDPRDIYNLEFELPDKLGAIRLGEVKDRINAMEQEKKQVQQQMQEAETVRNQYLNQINQINQVTQQVTQQESDAIRDLRMVEAEYNRINWQALEEMDAGRAALERQRFIERHHTAQAKFQQIQQMAEQQRDQMRQQLIQQHNAQLVKRIPEWGDPEVAKKEIPAIANWAGQEYGFTNQEFANLIDWRHREILRKAYMFDQLQEADKKARQSTPKQVSRGIKVPRKNVNDNRVGDLVNRAKQTRNTGDKIAAARAVLDNAFNVPQTKRRGRK